MRKTRLTNRPDGCRARFTVLLHPAVTSLPHLRTTGQLQHGIGHPCMRGEHHGRTIQLFVDEGSSPHARGTLPDLVLSSQNDQFSFTFTPAITSTY